MYKERLKLIANQIGKLLGIIGLVYVLYTLSQEYTWQSFIHKFAQIRPLVPALILLNIVSIVLGISAWYILLLHYAQKPFGFVVAYYYFAKTEIAKYLPGNIFHFIGRQTIASKIGLSQKEMAHTSFLFIVFILVGTLFAGTLFSIFTSGLPLYLPSLLFFISLLVTYIIYKIYPTISTKHKVSSIGYFTLSIALQGMILGMIIMYQLDTFDYSLFLLLGGIYIISWLIGFITPGASGGLGVREGAFIAIIHFLHLSIDTDIIIFSVLLTRLVNILVDILVYLSTYMIQSKIVKETP